MKEQEENGVGNKGIRDVILAAVGVVFQSVVSDSLTPWTATYQASLSFNILQNLLKLISIELMMPSNYIILVSPFSSCPQSFPASGSFPMNVLFMSGDQSIRASVSILLMNIQGSFPLGLTGLISLLSKGLSRVFSSITV